jgi:Transposase
MPGTRRSGRERSKSDPIDALAIARTLLREPDLPSAQLGGPAREVRLLVDHREDLVLERARIQNRLRWHLHELFPGLEIRPQGPSWSTVPNLDCRNGSHGSRGQPSCWQNPSSQTSIEQPIPVTKITGDPLWSNEYLVFDIDPVGVALRHLFALG